MTPGALTPGLIWIDGRLVPAAEAGVSVFDHGFTVGDGVFETLKVVDGRPFALRRHLERLHRSAAGLGLAVPVSDARLRAAVDEVLAAAGPDAGRLRLTLTGGVGPPGTGRAGSGGPGGPAAALVTAGVAAAGVTPGPGAAGDTAGSAAGGRPTLVVTATPQAPWDPESVAVTVPWPRNERSPLAGVKTTSYAENVAILAEARRAGADEALLANTAGQLCEGTGTNVFVHVGGRLLTPSLMSGCLGGVTRALLLEELDEADEDDLPLSVLEQAGEVLLTSSTREVHPVRLLDGRPLPGAPGPVAQRARAAWAALCARTDDP